MTGVMNTRRMISNLFRGLGYIVPVACLLAYFTSAESAEPGQAQHFLIIGVGAGVLCAVVGLVLRYIPEGEASIRKRAAQDYEERKNPREARRQRREQSLD